MEGVLQEVDEGGDPQTGGFAEEVLGRAGEAGARKNGARGSLEDPRNGENQQRT